MKREGCFWKGNNMKIIIIQGMTCLGKSTLCEQLEKDLPNCKYFSLDKYKENLWDKFGFDSVEEREKLSNMARKLFYKDITDTVGKSTYDYILVDYVFSEKYWSELSKYLSKWGLPTNTVYLKTDNLELHKKIWQKRSRFPSLRHTGHGATHYHDGVGDNYVNTYESKIFLDLPTVGDTLLVDISFAPYSRSKSYDTILDFIKEQHND